MYSSKRHHSSSSERNPILFTGNRNLAEEIAHLEFIQMNYTLKDSYSFNQTILNHHPSYVQTLFKFRVPENGHKRQWNSHHPTQTDRPPNWSAFSALAKPFPAPLFSFICIKYKVLYRVSQKITSVLNFLVEIWKHQFWAILGLLGTFEQFWALLDILGNSGHFWAF